MKTYYMIGIKGTGMSSLACMLHDEGNTVVGYDDYKEHKFTEGPLIQRDIEIFYDDSYVLNDEIVVYSAAFTMTHPEIKRCFDKGLYPIPYNQMLGELTKRYTTVCVSGCHGKTTTTAMLAHVLDEIIGTNYLIGDGTGHINKDNQYLVAESCEYRRHFLAYDPTYTIVTNIEMDHVDYYRDINDMNDAYQSLLNNTRSKCVLNGDDDNVRSLKTNRGLYFGFKDNNDIYACNIREESDCTTFDVDLFDSFYGKIRINFFGKHMIYDTLAVIGICYLLRLPINEVIRSISTFEGANRRFTETLVGDVVVVDDYAHHPTEIKATIDSARLKYPNKEIIALFLPNTYSRVQRFYKEFAEALNMADKAYVLDIFRGREKEENFPGISSQMILNLLNNGEYITLNEPEKLIQYKDAVLLFMSCQNIYILEEKYFALKKGELE